MTSGLLSSVILPWWEGGAGDAWAELFRGAQRTSVRNSDVVQKINQAPTCAQQ